ncbi:ubiquinone anaerobic biosynthesis protein UbiU [Undibacterium umbellatum]|jgi:putative protease|uniref:Ubiquinone biosynthesis protein UbiU n=1 Tax=Undibacterium umbellatum TaxID=2762300 RepID=A0ABR6ZHF9_9BURK|nr:peptidase U32 family protein [Undibacterium umbellatum]MBC3911166.1 U32 family peptidase [Undibacterium umbellatum]
MKTIDLVAPAGSLVALKAAIDKGADAVYLGLRNATNARNFGGLNFTDADIRLGVEYAHHRGKQVLFAINTYPQAQMAHEWRAAIDTAVLLGADAIILADPGLMAYARHRYPEVRLHLSVQSSSTTVDAIELMREQFGIRRAVLPRVLTLTEIEKIIRQTEVEIEVFGFGSLCVMAEGRCLLSSYVTGDSPNNRGVCSPGHAVSWEEKDKVLSARLSGTLIDRYAPNEAAGYPTLCKGRFEVEGQVDYALEEPTSLNAIGLLPQLLKMGVKAIKIEGRQRSPNYVSQVVGTLRAALDSAERDPERYTARPDWNATLAKHAEGAQVTQGAFERPWK